MLELEYRLGIKRRPPNAKDRADSDALVRQADQAQQQGTPEAYAAAQGLIAQALQKNPDNTAAMELDGAIRQRIGSTALSVLSPADTQKYKQALSLYLQGAVLDSYNSVLSLWESPRNRTYDALIRLKKRCEVFLNITP